MLNDCHSLIDLINKRDSNEVDSKQFDQVDGETNRPTKPTDQSNLLNTEINNSDYQKIIEKLENEKIELIMQLHGF